MFCNWKHAVNTIPQLNEVLSNTHHNCLELDITWNPFHHQSVVRHAPLSLRLLSKEITPATWIQHLKASMWLQRSYPKVIKFDFKHQSSVRPSIETMLKTHFYNIPHLTIWLNADILSGPGYPLLTPLDPHTFINDAQRVPNATLSLGWTTGFNTYRRDRYHYTQKMVDHMCNLTAYLKQPVTFAIRASLIRNSWNELKRLVYPNHSHSRTISVWTGNEGVPSRDLVWMKLQGITTFDVAKGSKDDWQSPNRYITTWILVYFGYVCILLACLYYKLLYTPLNH